MKEAVKTRSRIHRDIETLFKTSSRVWLVFLSFILTIGLFPASAFGQELVGGSTDSELSLSTKSGPGLKVRQVSLGSSHSAAILSDDSLWMWGENAYGQIGDGSALPSLYPKKIMDSVSSTSLGYRHSAAIKKDGSLWMWGDNTSGEIGVGGTLLRYLSPKMVLDSVSAVSCGLDYSAAVEEDGSLWMWGENSEYQLGNKKTEDQAYPTKLLDSVSSVSLGFSHSAAIKPDGSLWMWGRNTSGEIGKGSTVEYYTSPVKVLDSISAVSLGSSRSAAIANDGSLWEWGDSVLTPTKVIDSVSSISLGSFHSAVIRSDGTLWMRGNNNEGQIGDGTNTGCSSYVEVLDSVSSVSLGGSHSAAIKTDGSLWVWGSNSSGQLGDGFLTSRSTPVQVFFPLDSATINGLSVQAYTGNAVEPKPTVKLGDTVLTEGADYTLSYSDNVEVGTATVTVTGAGIFSGSVSSTFGIAVDPSPGSTTYTVSYNANGGTGTPSSQTKVEDVSLTLSSVKPTKAYTISYNANGGSVSPASKSVNCTFKNWNTERDGSGTSYGSGGSYTANSDATLYAQWLNPAVGTLATPSRSGYEFEGWFTSATGGQQVSASSTVTGNMTIYAHWADPYNLGDETYSFENYSDSDSFGGHCFGMSITSAGYHTKLLDIGKIGGNANTPLYSFGKTQIVKRPICYYQQIQGSYAERAIVAGGSYYLTRTYNIASDWQAVVNYVKNHSYDGSGLLQIGFRKDKEGGHAINFLRYENVNGQDRIYAYDNNYSSQETYFYRDSYGNVLQAPVQTFSGAIDCITLRDVRVYFNIASSFDSSHVIYMPKDAATVQGYAYTYMETDQSDADYVMYEIPEGVDKVTIIPNRDNADFIYMDTEYSFGSITDETRGELKFASMDEGAAGSDASFTIYEADSAIPTVTLSKTSYTYDGSAHKPTVTVKIGGTVLSSPQDYSVVYPPSMINAGKYEIKVTLKGRREGTVYKTFTINKANQTLAASVPASVAVGKTVKVSAKGTGKISYSTSNSRVATVTSAGVVKGVAAGKAIITVKAAGNGNYKAAIKTLAINVTKGVNPMVAKGKTVKIKASNVNKRNQVVKAKKAFSVISAQGKVVYKLAKVPKKAKSYIKLSSAGKLTVKKGLQEGKYKIKVKITARGNANWNAKTTTVTLTINIK